MVGLFVLFWALVYIFACEWTYLLPAVFRRATFKHFLSAVSERELTIDIFICWFIVLPFNFIFGNGLIIPCGVFFSGVFFAGILLYKWWNRKGRKKLAEKLAGYKHRAMMLKMTPAMKGT